MSKIIAIDIGNTNIKAAVFEDSTMLASFKLGTDLRKTSDEYSLYFCQMLALNSQNASDIRGAVVSSVIPRLNYTITNMCAKIFKVQPLFVGADDAPWIKNLYHNPNELGADRIATCTAASILYGTPCICVDFGTATVLSAVSAGNEFIGGAIFVGLKSAMDSLVDKTARLSYTELSFPKNVLGLSTADNMRSGLVHGFVGMLEHMVAKFREDERLHSAKVVATGGLCEVIAQGTRVIDVYDRGLSLKGLNLIWQKSHS